MGEKELFTKAKFGGKLVMVGCGSIGQGILPLLLKHTDITPERIQVVTADEIGKNVADKFGIAFQIEALTPENYKKVLGRFLSAGDFLLNLSVDTSSFDLLEYCQKKNALYLDTSKELWPGFHNDPALTISQRTNYAIRERQLSIQDRYKDGPTAVLSHGANPGLVSHFVKAALISIAKDTNTEVKKPKNRKEWAGLAQTLNIKVVHVAERDTQASKVIKEKDEFVNTWSGEGFVSEALQPVELGWGTHEKEFPSDAHEHDFGSKASVYLDRPGSLTLVRSWTPREGTYHGFLITHDESISTADYYTLKDGERVVYRPTVLYAYHPCDDAVLSVREYAGNNWKPPKKKRILLDEIDRGSDELGVLLMGHRKRSYWFGSDLSIAQTREVAEFVNATGLQVVVGALSGVIWALENPKRGLCEPEDLDFERILEIAMPYLGTVHGKYTSWTPLHYRKDLFPEDTSTDPWQFKNFRVM